LTAAYDWMAEQLRKRIGEPPAGVYYPVWAWHSLSGRHERPDLRRTEFRHYSGGPVCLGIEVPEAQVLLSDEEAWHIVLNDGYNCPGEDIDAEYEWFDALPEEERRRVKIQSWERIFDVIARKNPAPFIQGVFWQLHLDQVREVRSFKGRRL
jgi:hypothetical protein